MPGILFADQIDNFNAKNSLDQFKPQYSRPPNLQASHMLGLKCLQQTTGTEASNPVWQGTGHFTLMSLLDQILSAEFFSKISKHFWS